MVQDFCLFPSSCVHGGVDFVDRLLNRTEGFKLSLYLPSFLRSINRNYRSFRKHTCTTKRALALAIWTQR